MGFADCVLVGGAKGSNARRAIAAMVTGLLKMIFGEGKW